MTSLVKVTIENMNPFQVDIARFSVSEAAGVITRYRHAVQQNGPLAAFRMNGPAAIRAEYFMQILERSKEGMLNVDFSLARRFAMDVLVGGKYGIEPEIFHPFMILGARDVVELVYAIEARAGSAV